MYAVLVNLSATGPGPSEPPTFRSAMRSDIDAIVALWQLTGLGAAEGGADRDRSEIETRLERDPHLFVVAKADEQIIATVMGCYDGHRGWIKRFAVHPDHQRTGIGRTLHAELERRFVAAGITELRLSAYRSNERALDFWNDMGFDELDIAYFVKSLR